MKSREIAVVARDGRKTYARVFSSEGISSGEANCHAGDKFKPVIGAVIAMCRAYEEHPEKVCYEVMETFARDKAEAKAKAKAEHEGEPVRKKRVSMDKMPAGGVKKGRLFLSTDVEDMGKPGTPTMFKDMRGKSLFVGDLVTVQVLTGEVRYGRKWEDVPGFAFVVDEQSNKEQSKGQYIMGMLAACNDKTGKIDGRFRVRLAKRWQDVEVGEEHGIVKLCWADDGSGVKAE
jgi:hypothetical protein